MVEVSEYLVRNKQLLECPISIKRIFYDSFSLKFKWKYNYKVIAELSGCKLKGGKLQISKAYL